MKKNYLIALIFVFLLLSTNGIKAQPVQEKLNQVELMKQWIGTWKRIVTQDTTIIAEVTPFGNAGAIRSSWTCYAKDKIIIERITIWGYDQKNDKYIVAELTKNTGRINLSARWFILKNKIVTVPYEFISNPEKATTRSESEIKSPDMFTNTTFINNKPGQAGTYNRTKN